jgi:hypothetical protein
VGLEKHRLAPRIVSHDMNRFCGYFVAQVENLNMSQGDHQPEFHFLYASVI